MTISGVDVSHHQGAIDFAKVKASGRSFVVLKATESTNYLDPTLATNRRNAHAAGLVVGFYHFARAGNAAGEAAWFVKNIGTLQLGEFLVLDWEVPASNPPAWCKQWLDTVYAATGVRPLIYMNQSAVNGSNWSAVARDYGLWLAKYDQATSQPSVPHWGGPAMKQFYDKGTVPGIAGPCDVNVFFGSADQMHAYGKSDSSAPTPTPPLAPTVLEDDMRVVRTDNGTIWLVTDTDVLALTSLSVANAAQKVWGSYTQISGAELDLLAADATARRQRLLTDVQRSVLCNTPSDRTGAWLWDRIAGVDDKTGAIADDVQAVGDAVGKVQAPAVDAAALAAALLANADAVAKLGDAIAAGLATRVHNG